MGYRLEGPAIKHLHGHNIVSDGTVNGSIQVPGNGAADRADAGPRHQRRLSQDRDRDLGRFRPVRADPGRTGFRFKAVSMAEAQAEARKFAELLRTLPDRVSDDRKL